MDDLLTDEDREALTALSHLDTRISHAVARVIAQNVNLSAANRQLIEERDAAVERQTVVDAEVERLRAAVQAVRDAHPRTCSRCVMNWHCPDLDALDAALGGERT